MGDKQLIKSKSIIISIITLLEMYINILNSLNTIEGNLFKQVIYGIILALCDIMILCSIIEINNKPIKGILIYLISQIFTVILQIMSGSKISEALIDMSLYGILLIVSLIFNIVKAKNKLITDNKYGETNRQKIYNILNYNRNIYKVKMIYRVIIYSNIITVVLAMANSGKLNTLHDNIDFKIYSSAVLLIPIFLTISIITTSYIAYEIFVLKIFVEGYTLYLLSTINKLDIIQVIYILTQLIVIVYAYYLCYKNNDKQDKQS